MSQTKHINLDTIEIDPDVDDGAGFWIDGNRVTERASNYEASFLLPKGCRRIELWRLGNGQARLSMGGFTSLTVTVTGPRSVIERLKEAVL